MPKIPSAKIPLSSILPANNDVSRGNENDVVAANDDDGRGATLGGKQIYEPLPSQLNSNSSQLEPFFNFSHLSGKVVQTAGFVRREEESTP